MLEPIRFPLNHQPLYASPSLKRYFDYLSISHELLSFYGNIRSLEDCYVLRDAKQWKQAKVAVFSLHIFDELILSKNLVFRALNE